MYRCINYIRIIAMCCRGQKSKFIHLKIYIECFLCVRYYFCHCIIKYKLIAYQ